MAIIRSPERQAAWRKSAWLADAGISRNTYNKLPEELKPKFVKLFNQKHITEPPKDWWQRVGRMLLRAEKP